METRKPFWQQKKEAGKKLSTVDMLHEVCDWWKGIKNTSHNDIDAIDRACDEVVKMAAYVKAVKRANDERISKM